VRGAKGAAGREGRQKERKGTRSRAGEWNYVQCFEGYMVG